MPAQAGIHKGGRLDTSLRWYDGWRRGVTPHPIALKRSWTPPQGGSYTRSTTAKTCNLKPVTSLLARQAFLVIIIRLHAHVLGFLF
jgi:hypothetical protein